jgi:hypothetical protein
MKEERQEMENDKAKLVARLEQEAVPETTSTTPPTPTSPAAQSETSCDSWGSKKVKVTFKNPYVGRDCKDTGINMPGHPEHESMNWTACYDDGCPVHRSDKDGAGWYPSKPRPRPRRHRNGNSKKTHSQS